jgi:hypothetical protein
MLNTEGRQRRKKPLLFCTDNELLRLGQKVLDFYVLSILFILTQFPQLPESNLRFLNPPDFAQCHCPKSYIHRIAFFSYDG